MDTRRMRRLCTVLLHELERKKPSNSKELFESLCTGMSQHHGHPLAYRLTAFPPGTVSGLLVVTETQRLVLVESTVATEHQVLIMAHEFWHLENLDTGTQSLQPADATKILDPCVDADTAQHIATRIAARTDYCEHDEAEAELFGSMLASKVRKWLLSASPLYSSPTEDELANRLEVSLGRRGRRVQTHE